MSVLQQLFERMKRGAKVRRHKHPNMDSRTYWQPIERILVKYDHVKLPRGRWKRMSKELIKNIMKVPEFTEDNEIIEAHYFLIQQVRIPQQETITLRKIIQIALNIGQWQGISLHERAFVYFGTAYATYNDTKLDKLTRYVSCADIEFLSSIITCEDLQLIRDII